MRLLVFAFLPVANVLAQTSPMAPREVRLRLSDSITIVGDLYRGPSQEARPAILLFHQGGSNVQGEYATVVPRLLAEGFDVLATDVRGGGERYGGKYRGPATPSTFRYCSAIAEVEGAIELARANGLNGRLILWGSSYTGALVTQAAAHHPSDVRAVLAFSPASGDPLQECPDESFMPALKTARIPVLIVRSGAENVEPERRARLERLQNLAAVTYVAPGGGHGASVLVADRFEGDVAPTWAKVLEFLRSVRYGR